MLKLKLQTLATWCKEQIHWKRPWCWERLKAGGEGDDRGWDGWMASLTQCTWVWASSRSVWWTEKHGMLQSMGLQKAGHDWATELNWVTHHWRFHVYTCNARVNDFCLLFSCHLSLASLIQSTLPILVGKLNIGRRKEFFSPYNVNIGSKRIRESTKK